VTDGDELRALGRLIHTGRYVASAAAAVVVACEKESEYGVSDASRAIQSMILTAWGDGVGSNWTGWAGMEDVRKRVGLPEIYDVIAVVPFGYPKRAVGKGKKKRKPIAEVVSVGRYGTPID
jgi:nitroreductase